MSLADWESPEATLAISLMVPAIGTLLGFVAYSTAEAIRRWRLLRRLKREAAIRRWRGMLS